MSGKAQGLSPCTGFIFSNRSSIAGDRGVGVVSPIVGKRVIVAPITCFPT